MRLTGILATLGIAVLCFSGCGDSGTGTGTSATSTGPAAGRSGGSGGGGRPQIALLPSGTGEYWNAVHAGAVKAQLETVRGPSGKPLVDVLWREPLSQGDIQAQVRTVEDMMSAHVAAIVLVPSDAEALKDVVDRAGSRRVPVVLMESAVNASKPHALVATDEKHGGNLAGVHLSKLLGGKGKVIILHAQPGAPNAAAREEGFREALKEEAGLELLRTDRDGGATSDTAYPAAKRLLAQYTKPDGSLTIDGIFTPSESTSQGMLKALQELNLAGKVKFVGYGTSAKLVKALEAGEIQGLALQQPMNMGYLALKAAIEAIKKEDRAPVQRIDSGTYIATKENLATPETQEILHPDLEKWLK
jgi:ribose transport system substrate-binding protein